ncbi:hypothetical protein JCM8202v2_002701 [Rhodotorula sphaerocarpa]
MCLIGTGKDVQEALDDLVAKSNDPKAVLTKDDHDVILAIRAIGGSWHSTLPPDARRSHPPYIATFANAYHALTGRAVVDSAALAGDDVRHSELCHRLLVHSVLYLRVDQILQVLKAAQGQGKPAPIEARLLKQNYDALRACIARIGRESAASASDGGKMAALRGELEEKLDAYLEPLGEPALVAAV